MKSTRTNIENTQPDLSLDSKQHRDEYGSILDAVRRTRDWVEFEMR
jgi:hypothetical protein